jgi:hypothetical protein
MPDCTLSVRYSAFALLQNDDLVDCNLGLTNKGAVLSGTVYDDLDGLRTHSLAFHLLDDRSLNSLNTVDIDSFAALKSGLARCFSFASERQACL